MHRRFLPYINIFTYKIIRLLLLCAYDKVMTFFPFHIKLSSCLLLQNSILLYPCRQPIKRYIPVEIPKVPFGNLSRKYIRVFGCKKRRISWLVYPADTTLKMMMTMMVPEKGQRPKEKTTRKLFIYLTFRYSPVFRKNVYIQHTRKEKTQRLLCFSPSGTFFFFTQREKYTQPLVRHKVLSQTFLFKEKKLFTYYFPLYFCNAKPYVNVTIDRFTMWGFCFRKPHHVSFTFSRRKREQTCVLSFFFFFHFLLTILRFFLTVEHELGHNQQITTHCVYQNEMTLCQSLEFTEV